MLTSSSSIVRPKSGIIKLPSTKGTEVTVSKAEKRTTIARLLIPFPKKERKAQVILEAMVDKNVIISGKGPDLKSGWNMTKVFVTESVSVGTRTPGSPLPTKTMVRTAI